MRIGEAMARPMRGRAHAVRSDPATAGPVDVDQLADALTVLNVPLTLVPSVVTIEMHATRIRASMTAYSTAVGPSSLRRN
jgi:hypothetical protein